MTFFILVAALAGCHNPTPDNTDSVGINDDTGTPDPSTLGWLDADVLVLDNLESCQANVFADAESDPFLVDVIATDYTGDDELLSLKEGSYQAAFGLTAAEIFPEEDEDFVDAVNDVVHDLYLHADSEGNLWTGLAQSFTVTAGSTTPVEGNLSLVPALCPLDEDGCNGQNDEVGQWTVEENGYNLGQDFIEVSQFREETWLTISVPGVGDLILEGDRIYDETHEGGYVTAGWIEIYDLEDSSNDVVLWVGRDGDDPR